MPQTEPALLTSELSMWSWSKAVVIYELLNIMKSQEFYMPQFYHKAYDATVFSNGNRILCSVKGLGVIYKQVRTEFEFVSN